MLNFLKFLTLKIVLEIICLTAINKLKLKRIFKISFFGNVFVNEDMHVAVV